MEIFIYSGAQNYHNGYCLLPANNQSLRFPHYLLPPSLSPKTFLYIRRGLPLALMKHYPLTQTTFKALLNFLRRPFLRRLFLFNIVHILQKAILTPIEQSIANLPLKTENQIFILVTERAFSGTPFSRDFIWVSPSQVSV